MTSLYDAPDESSANHSLRAAFESSQILSAGHRLITCARSASEGVAANSVILNHSRELLLFAIVLLFFCSPWVSTGVNAALALLAGVFLLTNALSRRSNPPLPHSIDLALMAFIATHVVSIGCSPFFMQSVKGGAKMLIFWLAYLCFRMAFTQRSASLWVIGALIVTAGLQGTYGVYQWLVGVEPLANWEDPEALNPLTRVYGSLMNPNLLAGYLLSAFPIAAAVTVFSRGIYRAVAAFTACTTLICIFFTYSRGAYLGLLSSLGIFLGMAALLMWPRFKHQRGIVTAMVTALAALCAGVVWKVVSTPALLERLASIFTLRGHSSNSFRLNVWTGVWQMIQDNWLVGVGVGNNAFRKMYSLYMVSGYEALGAYNIFLEVLAELGILGLAAFLFINLLAWKTNWRTFRQGDPPARWMAAGITAALVGTWVMGLFDTVFYRPAIQLQFWLLLALTITWSGNIAPTSGISKNSTN